MLDHEKLDVYQLSTEIVGETHQIQKEIPRGYGKLREQLRKAALSIPLNIAEASGKTGHADRQQYYATARGSAFEVAAILDSVQAIEPESLQDYSGTKKKIVRVVEMLTKMCR